MTAVALSPRLTRILEIVGACVLFFMVASGLFYRFMGWNLGGDDLVAVCGVIMIYVMLFRSQLRQPRMLFGISARRSSGRNVR
jgi:hypothetical protein